MSRERTTGPGFPLAPNRSPKKVSQLACASNGEADGSLPRRQENNVSDQIDGIPDDSAAPAGNRRKPKKSVDREIVRLDAAPPIELAALFTDPPLAGNEVREDYESLFTAIAAAANPKDAIAWLFVRDITDLSWEIRRERALKLQVIKSAQIDQVKQLLTPPAPYRMLELDLGVDPNAEKIAKKAKLWASDPKVRGRIDKELANKGYDASEILTGALNRAADRIDAIDRRIASYELRRMTALRAMGHYNETLARRLEAVSSDVIEGKFTEAAE
jgi:hypothetical protein